jgi:3-isopropylmalate dehydratase small subunit
VYLVDIIATDGDGNETTKTISITVTDIDEVNPTITSVASGTVEENITGNFYKLLADEPVTYILGTSKDEMLFALAVDDISFVTPPDFETPQDGNGDNIYLFDVIATDEAGNTSTLEIAITVSDVVEPGPVFTSSAAVAVGENVTAVVYTAVVDVAATFSLGSSKDEALFTLSTDAISFISAPDFEMPLDANTDNVYLVDVIATDGDGNSTTKAITITVTDLDEVAPIFTSVATATVEENVTGIVYTAVVDEEATFSLGSSKDEALFTLATDAISFINSPDFEVPVDDNTDNVYLVDVIATDGEGNSTTQAITITVTDLDEVAPIITSATTATVEENVTGVVYTGTADEEVTFSLGSDKDEALFTLSTDAISFTAAPDFETPIDANADNVYLIELTATDAEGNATTLQVAISVTDLEEVPLANKEELLFNIYPNPFINRLVVEAKSAILKDAMIVIMDLSGKNKRSIKYNGGYQELDLSALKAGVYILAIPAEGGIAHFKIVKE